MRSNWDRWAIPRDDVDFWSSMRHVAGGARATVWRACSAEPVLTPTTGACTTDCDEPDVSCVTCSNRGRGALQSPGAMMRELHNKVTSAGNRGLGTVARTGAQTHRRWRQQAAAKFGYSAVAVSDLGTFFVWEFDKDPSIASDLECFMRTTPPTKTSPLAMNTAGQS